MAGWMMGMRKQVKRLVRKDVRVFITPGSVTWGYPHLPVREKSRLRGCQGPRKAS